MFRSRSLSLIFLLTICTTFAYAATPPARPSDLFVFDQRYIRVNNTLRASPSDPFQIPSTSLSLHTVKFGHEVPYSAFSTTLLTAFDELLQNALLGEIHDRQPIATTVSEWHEEGAILAVQGKGLAMEDLGSALRGLGLWAQKWKFDRRGGVSGVWSVEQISTGKRCDLKITKDPLQKKLGKVRGIE